MSSASDSSSRKELSRRPTRACSAVTCAACSWSSQKPGSPISRSSASRRCCSAAGSKVVREQLELVAEGRGGVSHLCPVTLLELLPGAAPARVVAPDAIGLLDPAGLNLRRRLGRRVDPVLGRLGDAGGDRRTAGSLGGRGGAQGARLVRRRSARVAQPRG